MTQTFRDMAKLTKLRALVMEKKVFALQAKEAALQADKSEVQTMWKNSLDSFDGADLMRLSGGDAVWQTWVTTRRDAINTELAQVLAEKDLIQQQASRAFGRRDVVELIASRGEAEMRRERLQKAQQAMLDLVVVARAAKRLDR